MKVRKIVIQNYPHNLGTVEVGRVLLEECGWEIFLVGCCWGNVVIGVVVVVVVVYLKRLKRVFRCAKAGCGRRTSL